MAVSSSWRLGLRRALVPWASVCATRGHLMRRPPRCSGLPSPRDASTLAVAQLPVCHRSRRHDRQTRPWLPGGGPTPRRIGGGSPPSRPASWPGNAARNIPGSFVRTTLHYQEGVVVLLQDGLQLGHLGYMPFEPEEVGTNNIDVQDPNGVLGPEAFGYG